MHESRFTCSTQYGHMPVSIVIPAYEYFYGPLMFSATEAQKRFTATENVNELLTGLSGQREVDNVEPTENAVDDCPQD